MKRLALLLAAAATLAGCGTSHPTAGTRDQQIAANLKAYLHATQIDQVQCSSQGTDGNGSPLQACDVLYETPSCHGSTNGAANQDDATVMIAGAAPQPGQTLSVTPGLGCTQP